jgi:Rap1a immunity proteins
MSDWRLDAPGMALMSSTCAGRRACDCHVRFSGVALAPPPRAHNALCFGYVVGVSDATQAAQATGAALFGWQACLPPSTTAQQVTEAAVHFLIAHPEAQQSSASGLITKALSDAFPCHPE